MTCKGLMNHPLTIRWDVDRMLRCSKNCSLCFGSAARPTRFADSEKITINMGFVDLGHIDLLVAEGFYGNRTDFIRTAISNQLATHGDVVKQVVARKMLVPGLQHFNAGDLRAVKAAHRERP